MQMYHSDFLFFVCASALCQRGQENITVVSSVIILNSEYNPQKHPQTQEQQPSVGSLMA